MFRIGEFSKLSMLTTKALRFYEREGLLHPAHVDPVTGYRYYEGRQLETAAAIKGLRQLGFSVEEIKTYLNGMPLRDVLCEKQKELLAKQEELTKQLSVIRYLMEDRELKYQPFVKEIGATVVYSQERVLQRYSDVSALILESAEECLRLNPDMECTKPDYSFCEYLDGEHKETGMRIRYSQSVTRAGRGNERICFRQLPESRAICIYHKGAYEQLGDAYAFLYRYAEENGYRITGPHRECYIDGVWNKQSPQDWLTEIQLPVE